MPVEGGRSFVKKDSNGSVQLGSRPDGHNLEVKKDGSKEMLAVRPQRKR